MPTDINIHTLYGIRFEYAFLLKMNDYTAMPQLVAFLKYQLLDFTNPELLWDQDYIHIIRGCSNMTRRQSYLF